MIDLFINFWKLTTYYLGSTVGEACISNIDTDYF